MSVKIMGMVFDACLKTTEKFVLLALADHADHQGANIYPAVETIANKCSLSERATRNILRALEARGVLIVERVGGGKRTNLWRIDLNALQALVRGASPAPQGGISCPSGGHLLPLRGASPAPDPSYNHPGPVPGAPAPLAAVSEPCAPEGAAGVQGTSTERLRDASESNADQSSEKPRAGRLSDPISDLIANIAYSAPKGTRFTSVTANKLLKDRAGAAKPSATDAAALVKDLRAMYTWWSTTKPTLSAPGKYESISRALSEWRRATPKNGLVYAPVPQADGTYRMEWTHEDT